MAGLVLAPLQASAVVQYSMSHQLFVSSAGVVPGTTYSTDLTISPHGAFYRAGRDMDASWIHSAPIPTRRTAHLKGATVGVTFRGGTSDVLWRAFVRFSADKQRWTSWQALMDRHDESGYFQPGDRRFMGWIGVPTSHQDIPYIGFIQIRAEPMGPPSDTSISILNEGLVHVDWAESGIHQIRE